MKVQFRTHKTYPVIIHSPGGPSDTLKQKDSGHQREHPVWKVLFNYWQKIAPPEPGPDLSREMTIITWNTSPEKSILELSLDKLGLPYTVLGQGRKNWSNPLKMNLAIKFLSSVSTPYVLALDAYDVLVLDTPAIALDRFKQMDCDILFNASPVFFPNFGNKDPGRYISDTWKLFQEKVGYGNRPYINSGACIAKTKTYIAFARDCQSRDVSSLIRDGKLPPKRNQKNTLDIEQVRVYWGVMDWYPKVQPDYQSRVFLNTKLLSRKDILISRPFFEKPLEWLAIHADHTRILIRAVFKILLNKTRAFRGRLGLRRIQWKK